MRRKFTLNKEEEFFVLKDTNPNRDAEPFKIGLKELKFDTVAFYDYVFAGIDEEYNIEIDNRLKKDDKVGAIVFKTLDEIVQGVLEKLKEK